MRLNSFIKILLVAIMAAGMSACSSRRAAVAGSSSPSKRVKAMNVAEVGTLAETYQNWETFYAPFTLRISEPMDMSVSGRATMVRDKYIYLSLRMLGFEVATVYVNSDSAYVADKYHKILAAESISSLTAGTGLTVGDLQDILMGRAFYPGQGTLCSIEVPEALFSPSFDGDFVILTPRRIPGGASWFFTIDNMPSLRRITVEPDGFSPLTVDYAETVDVAAGAVATQLTLIGNAGNKDIEAMCLWNLGKAKWNQPVNEPSLNFKGYRRISATDLLEILKQM